MQLKLGATGVLAIVAIAGGLYVAWRAKDIALALGNAAVDGATGTLHAAARGTGGILVGAVDAVPGLTDYLKDISSPYDASVVKETGAAGSTMIDGQTYTFGY